MQKLHPNNQILSNLATLEFLEKMFLSKVHLNCFISRVAETDFFFFCDAFLCCHLHLGSAPFAQTPTHQDDILPSIKNYSG